MKKLLFLPKNKIDIMQRVTVTLCIISIPFFQSFSKRYSKTNLKIDIPSENIHFRMQVYKGKNYFILPKVASHSLNKYMDNERTRIQQASAKLRNVFVKALLWC